MPAAPHRSAVLAIVLCVQLLNAVDITVMNMALPQIQRQFDFSPTALSWVLNAYTLAYGGLLLLGGRMGDILGHRRVLLLGVADSPRRRCSAVSPRPPGGCSR